jgi:hypothetical protein
MESSLVSVLWLKTTWPTDIWSTGIWPTGIWPTGIWPTGIWPTGIWPTGIWPIKRLDDTAMAHHLAHKVSLSTLPVDQMVFDPKVFDQKARNSSLVSRPSFPIGDVSPIL